MWEQAKEDPTKCAIFVGWWRDERNQFPVTHPFFIAYMPQGIETALLPLERKRVRQVREATMMRRLYLDGVWRTFVEKQAEKKLAA